MQKMISGFYLHQIEKVPRSTLSIGAMGMASKCHHHPFQLAKVTLIQTKEINCVHNLVPLIINGLEYLFMHDLQHVLSLSEYGMLMALLKLQIDDSMHDDTFQQLKMNLGCSWLD
ncbi:hypothetical protein O6H91_21G018600 [Diphasiastrum complanatum]|uniref:Uncharacterized protein n=1 Tax=Diphasiastrum complanatum TaxID=34168 RepID=A0ACC2AIC1_DIPCM|nr:hypothetical protein O6H91_21G018600 [Diphasiastrum complanatum]